MIQILALASLALVLAPNSTLSTEELQRFASESLAQRRFDVAAQRFGELYHRTMDPWALYNQAQSVRLGGNCPAAIRLYQEVIEAPSADERDRFQAQMNIDRCRAGESSTPPPETPPKPPASRRCEKWACDLEGWLLVGAGVVSGAAVGVPLFLIGRNQQDQDGSTSEGDFVEQAARGQRLEFSGAVLMAVGSGLLVSGIVRWVWVARYGRKPRRQRGPLSGQAIIGYPTFVLR